MEKEENYTYGPWGWEYHRTHPKRGMRYHRVSGPQETKKYDWVEATIPSKLGFKLGYMISHNFVVGGKSLCYIHICKGQDGKLMYKLASLLYKK
jgi:hypothetical protein